MTTRSPDLADVSVSRPAKVMFPDTGLTKADVVEHYEFVADAMLPHLRERPLTLRRFPDGIGEDGFFQKEVSEHFPRWLDAVDVPLREDGTSRQVVCSDAASLRFLADQATLELHIWPSTVAAMENPDLLVLDIDPPGDAAVSELRSVARRLRELFSEIGLTAYVQATGGRGFHVVAPLDRTVGFDPVRQLSLDAAEQLVRDDPDRLTTAFRKQRRGDRIFLDTNRNGYAQTFIAPYSLRSRPGAPCAVPLDWEELDSARPDGWDPRALRKRLSDRKDPWARIHRDAASAKRAAERLARMTE